MNLFRISDFGFRISAALIILLLAFPTPARAAPTQQDVFNSIHEGMGSSVDGKTLLEFALVAVGIILLMAFLSRRQEKRVVPKNVNSQAKLMKELIKTAGLKPAEARQLRALAERMAKAGKPVESPVTLMLAPSWVRGDRPARKG